jgi:hypothetical protein
MSKGKLKLLLNTMQEYGLRREVDPPVVLGGFLNQSWSYKPSQKKDELSTKDKLSRFLILESYDKIDECIKVAGNGNKGKTVKILKDFLKQILWTNPEAFEKRLKKKKFEEISNEKEQKYLLKSITYNPFNRRLLGEIRRDLQIGQTLFECLNKALHHDKEKMDKIKDRLNSLEFHQEVEEKILETLFLPPDDNGGEENSNMEFSRQNNIPDRAENYTSLFGQLGDDLLALLELDIPLLSKSRILLYLEKITNLYALLYYLRIICVKTDPPGELPLILPLCSNELDDRFKDYSDTCFQLYRQISEDFWRKYLYNHVDANASVLGCRGKDPFTILEEFSKDKNATSIFGQIGSTSIMNLKEEIKSSLVLLQKSSLPTHVHKFTEAYLIYNLKGQRTLARMKLILDWQGAGAGIVAPEKVKGKHFHLKPELLETFVIIFYSRNRHQQDKLSLRDFIAEIRRRYGIILGPSETLDAELKKQGLPIPQPSLLKRNFGHLISMLMNLNMLERLSDKAMFIKCPFPFKKEEQ